MKLYKKKFRIETSRLSGFDYRSAGLYFVTICCKKKLQWFGEILGNKCALSEEGKIASEYWLEIPNHYPNIILDEFIVMPDHLHGILIFTKKFTTDVETPHWGVSGENIVSSENIEKETPHWGVSTNRKKRTLLSGSLGAVINQFKTVCTKKIRKNLCPEFSWQTRFYDRIIRSTEELNQIRKYILNNHLRWNKESVPWDLDGYNWSA